MSSRATPAVNAMISASVKRRQSSGSRIRREPRLPLNDTVPASTRVSSTMRGCFHCRWSPPFVTRLIRSRHAAASAGIPLPSCRETKEGEGPLDFIRRGYRAYGELPTPTPLAAREAIHSLWQQHEARCRDRAAPIKDANVSLVGASAPTRDGTTFYFVGESTEARVTAAVARCPSGGDGALTRSVLPMRHSPNRCTSSRLTSTFRMRRSAADGSTPPDARACPEGVRAVVCLDNPPRQYEGQGPMDSRLTGTPGGRPWRCQCIPEGWSGHTLRTWT